MSQSNFWDCTIKTFKLSVKWIVALAVLLVLILFFLVVLYRVLDWGKFNEIKWPITVFVSILVLVSGGVLFACIRYACLLGSKQLEHDLVKLREKKEHNRFKKRLKQKKELEELQWQMELLKTLRSFYPDVSPEDLKACFGDFINEIKRKENTS